ncbi:MAG: response regulator transcription factor [Anaerolineae bacterium]|jgi:DNA-binding response OmpR family regulator
MSRPIRTLLVDDDEAVRQSLAEILSRVGHQVTTVASGEEALDQVRDTPFDLAILDLQLGGYVDGLRLLEAINWRWPDTAKVILTGHGSLDSAMVAIREGVDAYLLKPIEAEQLRCTLDEVLASRQRAQAEHRHIPDRDQVKNGSLKQGPFAIGLRSRIVTRDDEAIELSQSEFDLLVHLVRNADRVVPPPELVKVVRNYECEDMQEAREIIKWYVHRLRQKVERTPSRPRHILNVRGVGYTFKA